MSNLFINLPAPAGDGAGTAVDVSAMGQSKTIVCAGSWTLEPTINVEINNNSNPLLGSWQSVATFQGAGNTVVAVACRYMRISVKNYRGGQAPVVNVGSTDAGTSFATLVATAGNGAGASVDTSSLPLFKTIQVSGVFRGNVIIEFSCDGGVTWAQAASLQSPGVQSSIFAADFMRVVRNGVPVNAPGLPTIDIGACDIGGGSSNAADLYWVNVLDYGADPTGVADSRTAFMDAVAAAIADGKDVYVPEGRYQVSKYVDIADAVDIRIFGSGKSTIIYPSDDIAVVADGTALTNQQARSAFLIRYGVNVAIDSLTFEGGDAQQISTVNIGCAIYATHSVGVKVTNVSGVQGYGLFYQDSQPDTSGQGDSLAVSSGTVTLTDAAGLFRSSMVGRMINLGGCTNAVNTGVYEITEYVSATQIRFVNADAIAETSAFRWSVDNHDQSARIEKCTSYAMRGYITLAPDTVFTCNTIQRPGLQDATGIGNQLAFSGGTVTLTCALGGFLPPHDGKYVTIAGATSPGNNGTFRLTYISATQISWANGAGVSEVFSGTWWIQCGDTTGIGAGVGGLVIAATTVTLTAAAASFAPTDVGKVIVVRGATTPDNNGPFVISAYVGPTQIQYTNALGATEAYSGTWGIDAFDNGSDGSTYGSTHGIYLQSGNTGRRGIIITDNVFIGIRTTCIKWSGSAARLGAIDVSNNYAEECGALFQGGADDSQEHVGAQITDNILVDVATGREGWNQSNAISFLGARGVTAHNNQFNYRRNAIGSVSGAGVAELTAIEVGRVLDGQSQPISDVTISENKFTAKPAQTTPQAILLTAIRVRQAGQLAKWGTGGSFTKAGNVMTLTAGANRALFAQEDVGKQITLVNSADAGNDGTFTIETVVSTSVVTYTNAAGVGGGASAGTWRIPERSRVRGSGCSITNNRIINVGESGITTKECVGPEIKDNTFAGLLQDISMDGDVAPRVTGNREVGIGTLNGHILLVNPVSWPYFDDNTITNNAIGTSSSRMMDIATAAAANRVDYPLCGKRGRCKTADARNQVVVAYGSKHVDGDTITVAGTTYTFKTVITDPATQFNSFATLVALIDAQANMDCSDYGTGFHFTEDGANGIGGDIVDAAGTTTLTVTGSPFSAGMVGRRITIKNATTPANDGVFTIASYIDPNNITYANGAGVTETVADLQWFVDGSVDDITTQHLLIQAVTPTTTDASLIVSVSALNPTALVMPRNATSPNTTCRGVGFGAAGPTAVTSVAWSLSMTREGGITFWPDNAVGQNLLQANGWRPLKPSDGRYSGACEVINHGESMGTEEWRWALA